MRIKKLQSKCSSFNPNKLIRFYGMDSKKKSKKISNSNFFHMKLNDEFIQMIDATANAVHFKSNSSFSFLTKFQHHQFGFSRHVLLTIDLQKKRWITTRQKFGGKKKNNLMKMLIIVFFCREKKKTFFAHYLRVN